MYINGQKLKIKKYSSGEFKFLRSTLLSYVKNGKVEILSESTDNIFTIMLAIDYYKNLLINNNGLAVDPNFNKDNITNLNNNIYKKVIINLILSYLPYQRMDHEQRDELNTLSNVANIINNLNLNSVTICEPHSNIIKFNNAKEFSYIKYLKNNVLSEIGHDVQIVFTDKGAKRRYNHLFDNSVYFNKVRDSETGLIIKHEIVGGQIDKNKNYLIIDDIISTGDTIVNIVNFLENAGVKNIYVLCGHFEKNKYNKRLFKLNCVKKVFSTNSLSVKQNKKLKLYNVREMFYGTNNN